MSRLASVLFLVLTACATTPPQIDKAMRDLLPNTQVQGRTYAPATVEERMRQHDVPAVSIAVIDGDRVVWTRAYGMADVEENRKATTRTLFQAASISKPVAATGALTLVDDGQLSLDEDVNARLRSWKVPPFEFKELVTLRRLLSHTAGLTVHGFPGYAPGTPVPTGVQVLDGVPPTNTKPVRVDIEPGSKWRYAGGGYVVLQTLVSDVTGKPFPEVMRERVLAPAGMRTSTYEQPLPAALRPLAAAAYHGDGDSVKGKYHTYPEMAAAGLGTTPAELSNWILALDELLSPATLKEMFTEQKEKTGFGLGIGVSGTGNDLQVSHSGSNEGFRCTFVYYPARRQGVVVMTNSDSGSAVGMQMLHAIARQYGWPGYKPNVIVPIAVPVETLQEYAGAYQHPDLPIALVVSVEEGRVFMTANNNKQELVPVEKDVFASVQGGRMRFERDESGKVTNLLFAGRKLPRKN